MKTTYVVYDQKTTEAIKYFDKESLAKRRVTVANKKSPGRFSYASFEDYQTKVVTKVTVKSLMTGEDVVIDSNTPLCCDPSSETYWSC